MCFLTSSSVLGPNSPKVISVIASSATSSATSPRPFLVPALPAPRAVAPAAPNPVRTSRLVTLRILPPPAYPFFLAFFLAFLLGLGFL